MHGTFHSYWQISEECARIISQFRGVTKTDFWNTHPNMEIEISNKMDVFFLEIGLSRPRKLKFRKSFWMSFPRLGAHFASYHMVHTT